jgi:hypothetical protein
LAEAVTFVSDSATLAASPAGTLRVSALPCNDKQVWAEMTATLSAELEGRVPPGLVVEIVRAVLDESRQAARGRTVELINLEARLRLERFIRARACR